MPEKDTQIQWTEKTVRLTDLRPYEANPRTITDVQFQKLKESIIQDGYHSRIKVTHDLRVIGGHQRLRAMAELGYEEALVLVPSKELSADTFRRILIRDNHNNGIFDMDILANLYDLEELRDFGIHDVMNIPPMDLGIDVEEKPKPDKGDETVVKCPNCENMFKTKGNEV